MDTIASLPGASVWNSKFSGFLKDESAAKVKHGGTKVYDELGTSKREIRLMKFADSQKPGRIDCVVVKHALDEVPPYTAISYAWGHRSAHHKVHLNGHSTVVTENLWRFLEHMNILRRRQRYAPWNWFWIDALCIDQGNFKERKDQVALMAEIYSKASEVLVWLGPSYHRSDNVMKAFARDPMYWHTKKCYLKFWKNFGGLELLNLCRRPYWTRLWTFQELGKAREIRLMCGLQVVSWADFESFLLYTIWSKYYLPDQHEHTRLSVLSSPAMSRLEQKRTRWDQTGLLALMEATKSLKCSEPKDKVYALLGVIDSDIAAEYEIPLGVLLNLVLRHHHQLNPPKSFEEVLKQCRDLCGMFDLDALEVEHMFHLHDGWGQIPVPSATDVGRIPLSIAPGHINLWWATFYGHTTIETMIYESGRVGEHDLTHACKLECSAAVELMFGKVKPFNVNGQYRDSNTMLSYAIKHGNDAMALCMISQSSCNVNLGDRRGRKPLYQAMDHDRYAILEALLQRSDLNADDAALLPFAAVESSNETALERLLKLGRWDADQQDKKGRSFLIAALEAPSPSASIVWLLLEHAAARESPDYRRRTTLGLACRFGLLEIAAALLSKGADSEARDLFGDTALACALKSSVDESIPGMVDLLLQHGADPNAPDKNHEPLLIIAIRKRYYEALISLIEHRANVDARGPDEDTPLIVATRTGDRKAMLKLIEHNADVEARDSISDTPLMIAIRNRNMDAISTLLEHGANVEAKDRASYTPLIVASWNSDNKAILKLVVHNANIEARGQYSYTPLMVAIHNGNNEAMKELIENQAKINAMDDRRRTPLMIAIEAKNHGAVTKLIERGADVDAKDYEGNTPLHLAVRNGNEVGAEILLSKGKARTDVRNNHGQTAEYVTKRNRALALRGGSSSNRSKRQATAPRAVEGYFDPN